MILFVFAVVFFVGIFLLWTAKWPNGENHPDTGATTKSNKDVIEELKGYKELLDSGIITQEEFETKKEQLLNLVDCDGKNDFKNW